MTIKILVFTDQRHFLARTSTVLVYGFLHRALSTFVLEVSHTPGY